MPEAQAVRTMFAGIARRYDVANRLLSMGIDVYWRRVLRKQVAAATEHSVKPQAQSQSTDSRYSQEAPHQQVAAATEHSVKPQAQSQSSDSRYSQEDPHQQVAAASQPKRIADLACGSGDVTFALAKYLPKNTQFTGMDFCQPMLDEAVRKKQEMMPEAAITFEQGDCLNLPLPDASQDVVTIAFGVRNFEDRARGLREMRRVLRDGGSLFVLEFTQPDRWFRPFYYFYLKVILPLIAGIVTGDRSAYQYLAGSIEAFPTRQSLAQELRDGGFSTVSYTALTFGIVAIHKAVK